MCYFEPKIDREELCPFHPSFFISCDMKLHLNLSLRRALMAAMSVVATLASSSFAGMVDSRYDLQYYMDFARNKGMFSAGATNISVYYKDGTAVTNPVIPIMPNLDSYGKKTGAGNGGCALVNPQFVVGAAHVGSNPVYFLSENGSTSTCYTSAGYKSYATDVDVQRLNKIVTEVAYTPMADDSFMQTLSAGAWLWRLGDGMQYNSDGEIVASLTGSNTLGGIVGVNSISKWANGTWVIVSNCRESDVSGDLRTPLDIGHMYGDSGSPHYAWDAVNNRFVYVAACSNGSTNAGYNNSAALHSNPSAVQAGIDSFTVAASVFSGTETILWNTQDAATGKGTLTQGDVSVEYTGLGTGNTLNDTLGLAFSTTDTENVQTLELQGSVDMGAGAVTFDSGKWKLTEKDAAATFNSAGFVVNSGAELSLELTGTASEEWRKVGEGTLTIAGSGNNDAVLRVGGGETQYEITYDESGNITGCTLGNIGETRLNRTDGYAASSVRLEAGAAIVVLMADNQFKTNSVAGDTFTFGNNGGLLNLNGHDLTWGVINQDGSGTGARIGNKTPLGETAPGNASFTYTGTGTFAGCFVDEGTNSTAQLAVVYNNAEENATWTLTGNHSNVGGFTVEDGTMVLQGSNTPHVRMTDSGDWTYATLEGSDVTVKSGATFQLSHHALMTGNVIVEDGGAFILNQTVNAASESVGGSLRQDMAALGITSLRGNVTLAGNATMTANTESPVTTTIQGNITSTNTDSEAAQFTKQGSGILVVNGQLNVPAGTVEAGGLVIKDATENNWQEWTIGEQGFLAVEGLDNSTLLSRIDTSSSGVLALSQDQETQLELSGYQNLIIGAWGNVSYGTNDVSLTTVNDETYGAVWRLGGGTGTLTVNFKLTGDADLLIGNEWSSGTVHLANAANDFSGDIYILGTGNKLSYADGALGSARVNLTYGNALALNDPAQLDIIKDGSSGVLALATDENLDLSGTTLSLGANGAFTYTGSLTVDEKYRFGGSGQLTVDTDLDGTKDLEIDGQGTTGSSVIFARENAFTGSIIAGGGLALDEANSSGDVGIRVGHASALAAAASVTLQKGAVLYTDGNSLTVNNLSMESGSALRNNGSTNSLVLLNVTEGTDTSLADGVLNSNADSAALHLVKSGQGTLTMGANANWSGGLTIAEGTVKATITSTGDYTSSGGIGSSSNVIYVAEGATLSLSGVTKKGSTLGGTTLIQTVNGIGTIEFSTGGAALFSEQSSSFEGTIKLMGNTRLYVGTNLYTGSAAATANTKNAVNNATIEIESGSQVRITSSLRYLTANKVSLNTDFVISGTGFSGSDGAMNNGATLVQSSCNAGALSIDGDSTVYGNITLKDDASIASWSAGNLVTTEKYNGYLRPCTSGGDTSSYALKGYLGGTVRGKILGEGKTLTISGNEGMTFTADSENTYGDLVIANGNGNNDDKFALRLNGGTAVSQTSTALGKGSVTLNAGLILRLAGTGTANNTDVVYTYENAISAGNGATLQSYNITNRLTGTVTMSGTTLNLATANGGVLELAGGISGSGTLNVAANSAIVIGSASSAMSLARSSSATFNGNIATEAGADITLMSPAVVSDTTTFSGTDSLTLRLSGTEDYTLGGIMLSGSTNTDSDGNETTTATALTLNFDFSNIPNASNESTYTTLNSDITADSTVVSLSLNMFNDIESGIYTLATGTLSGDFSLKNTLNDRLSLTQDNGSLVLTVGTDNRLYWRGEISNEWNTTDANWYQESSGGNVAFTSNAYVVLAADGAENSTANSRETITLSADRTVGTLCVKDETSFYEVTGTATLSGTDLAVGMGGNLKLSTTNASFSGGVLVDNASLEVSGTSLTANVTARNGSSFALSDNATLTGTLSISDAEATINSASVTGNISTAGTGSATLNNLTLTGEIIGENGGRIITASAYNGTTATTKVAATLSGSLNWGSGEENSLSLASGSLYLDGAVNLSNLSVGDGLTVTIWNNTAAAGADKVLGTVNLGNNAILQTNDRDKVSATTSIGSLSLSGASATLRDQYHSGYYAIDSLSLGEDITSATLNIVKIADSTLATVVNLGSEEAAAGNFKGTIVLNSDTGQSDDSNRSLFLVLGGERTAAGAVVNMSSSDSNTAVLGLGVNTDNAVIAGLSSASGLGNRVKVFSGSVGTEVEWGSSASAPSTVGDALRTLTIDAASGSSHAFYGEVMSNLNLVKTGDGTQKLLGTSSNFNGSISVEAGTLALGSSSAVGALSGLTVSDGATLDLSGFGTDFSSGITFAQGATGTLESGATIAFDTLAEGTEYRIFTISDGVLDGWTNLTASNFTISGTKLSDMGHTELSLGMSGTFSYTINRWDLVWNGGESGTWNKSDESWQTTRADSLTGETSTFATSFVNNDNVTFNSNASVNVGDALSVGDLTLTNKVTVTLNGSAVSADKVVIESGSKLKAAYASVLAPTKAFDIAEGAELEVNVPGDPSYTAEVSGKGTITMTGSGTLAWNPTDGTLDIGTLNITDGGTFKTESALTVETMNLGVSKSATLRYQSAGAGKDKHITNLNMANGAVLQTYDESVPTAATCIGTLTMQGSTATLKDSWNSGYTRVDTLKLDKGVSSSTLVLNKYANSSFMSIFELGSASVAAGNFAGTIELKETRGGEGDRSAAVILSGAEIAQNAVISISSATSNNTGSTLALGINADKATISGLSSASGLGVRAKLFSGTLASNEAWVVDKIDNAARRTLTINTAAGKTHEFYGEVLGNLDLVISGSGTQKFLGTAGSFDGSLTVKSGTLVLNSTSSAMLGNASAVSLTGGVLDLSAISFSESGGIALSGAMTVTNGSINLGTNLAAGTTYDIFTIADGASLDWENMGDYLLVNGTAVSRYSGASLAVTDAGVATLSFSSLDKSSVYWVGGESGAWDYSSSSWDVGAADADVGNNVSFLTNDTVVFASDASVTVADGVTVGGLTIEAGKHLTTTGGIEMADSAAITTGEGSRWTLAAGTEQTLSKTQVNSVTALEIAKGATLAVSDSDMAGNTAINLSGEGTVELNLSDAYGNTVNVGSGFKGETYVTGGSFTVTSAVVGETLRLANGVNMQSAESATVAADLILEGTTTVHANSSKSITYKGTVTGENGVFDSNGSSSHTFMAEVDLAGFKTSHSSNTNTFDAKTSLDTATISQATVNFNGETALGTAAISGGTTNFNGAATLASLTQTGGTINANGTVEVTGKVAGDGGTLALQSGELKLSYNKEDGNSINLLDGSKSGSATGTLRLAQNVSVTVAGQIRGRKDSSVVLESGAELVNKAVAVKFSNRGTAEATFRTASSINDAEYSTNSINWELTNAHLASTASEAKTLTNKLVNSSVENAGSGHLTVSNSGNSITDVYATAGNIDIEQLNAAVNLNLSELTVAESKTVGLYSGSGDGRVEANVTVTSHAKFGSGAVLNANLTLASGSTLSVAEGGLAMGSTLTLQKGLTLDDTTLGRVHALSVGESTALFTGVDGLTLDKTTYTSLTENDSMLANPYFTNLNSGNQYVLTYSGTDNGTLSIMAASVPEPTTTTLSLLALSALAMRRRRK